MAKGGFKVMDSDMHIVEPADLWERYIDPAFRTGAPKGMSRHPRDLGVQVGETVYPLPGRSYSNAIAPLMTAQMEVYAESEERGWDSKSQLVAMDSEGIDAAVLFPAGGCSTLGLSDMEPALATAISRAYNDWLADFCAAGEGRMFGAGMVPPHDIEGAIGEARRAVNELGFKTVFVRPQPGERAQLARPLLRRAVGGAAAARGPAEFPRRRASDLPQPWRQLRYPHALPYLHPPHGHDAGGGGHRGRRRARALPRAYGRLPGGQLLLGPMATVEIGRATTKCQRLTTTQT